MRRKGFFRYGVAMLAGAALLASAGAAQNPLRIPAQAPASTGQAPATDSARTLIVRLVEARSGKPMRNKLLSIAFYVEDASMTGGRRRIAYPDGQFWTNVTIDKDGVGSIQVPRGATIVEVGRGLDNDGLKSTEKTIELSLCRDNQHFTRADPGYQYGRVEDVLRSGYLANAPDCAPRLKMPVMPGQFVAISWPPSRNPLASGITW